jgi:hypothetical protein
MFEFIYRMIWSWRLKTYLLAKPRLRAQLGFEIDRPQGSNSGEWLYYDNWPSAWKARLVDFCLAYARGKPLPIENPLPLADKALLMDTNQLGYRNADIARDTYLAQVAYALWLDITGGVPWRLEDWSDHELSFLLSSKVCFSAYRTNPGGNLYYVVTLASRTDATENILADPRTAYNFLLKDPEQGQVMIGATPNETGQKLSAWFHDYLWHNPSAFDPIEFYHDHPILSDRLRRYNINPYGSAYITPYGCGSASALFADLMRSVNIPVRKVTNVIESFEGTEEHHIGLVFDWQGGTGTGRYLLHTDDLYTSSYFKDPAPAPKNTGRGVALWDQVWLDPTKFGERFSYDSRPEVFGKATSPQKVKYWEMGDWLVSSAHVVQVARSTGREGTIDFLQRERGFTRVEAEACWSQVEASVLAYGDGNMTLGYQRLLDGPGSRHEVWCTRTGKCG